MRATGRGKSVVLSIIAVILLAYIVTLTDFKLIYEYLRKNSLKLLFFLVLAFVIFLLRITRNFIIFRSNEFTKVSLFRFISHSLIAGVVSTYGPLKSGELVAIEIYNQEFEVERGSALATIVGGRVVDIVIVLGYVSVGIVILSEEYVANIQTYLIMMVFILAIVITILLVRPIGYNIFLFLSKIIPKKFVSLITFLETTIEDYYNGIRALQNLRSFLLLIIFSVLRWIMEVIYLYLFLQSFNIDIEILHVLPIIGFSFAIGVSSGTPGALGTSQLTSLGIMVLYGIDPAIAASIVVIGTAIGVVLNIILTSLGLLVSSFKQQNS